MRRKYSENEVDMIQALNELKTFLESDYIRLGHTEDEDVIALKKAIDAVVAAMKKGVWNDAAQTALGVIGSAISENETGWLRAVLGDHDDASFERARELCVYILTFLHTQDNENRKGKGGSVSFENTKNRTAQFCEGMDAQDQGRCGCILTGKLKTSAKHVRNIIKRCQTLPLHDADIQGLLVIVGLAAERDCRTGEWALAGPLYVCYVQTRLKKRTYIDDLMRLCRTLWSYTKDGLRVDRETCALFTSKYVLHYAAFRTIVSEVRQFVDTYPLDTHPLPETGEGVGAGDEPRAAAVRPHIIVFRLIPHTSVHMLLGGMRELM